MVTAPIGKVISASTVRRRLHMNGLNARVPGVCVPLSIKSRGTRLKWCREHGNRRKPYGVGRDFIRIPHTELHIFKRGSVTAVRYRDEVLEPNVRLYAAAVDHTFVLMNDYARPHRADIVNDYLESEGIARMAWPAYSPDRNPIEKLWDVLGRAVFSRFPPPATLFELETALQEEWRLLNSAVVDHLIESMVRRRTHGQEGNVKVLHEDKATNRIDERYVSVLFLLCLSWKKVATFFSRL
ncbi:transposable element Tcb1 transposase [Trichonephila clavipes]|nr:transposable element Tcb1 transposase [Trichonephila clavipes]